MKGIVDEETISMFVPLKEILLEDTEEIKKIKSLYQREEGYSDLLGPIENSIAYYYLDNKKLKDVEVIKILRNIKQNIDKNLDFFKSELEKMIMISISVSLQLRRRTKHEVILALAYILWAIDNRSYLGSRGYLDWVINFFGLTESKRGFIAGNLDGLSEKDKERALKIAKKHFGLDDAEEDEGFPESETSETKKESEEFVRKLEDSK